MDEAVKQVEDAAARPLEHPLNGEKCDNKCANKALGKMLDTHMLSVAVAKAEIASERKCPATAADLAEEQRQTKMACKLGDLIDTTCLNDKVETTEKAAARPHENPLTAENCNKCPNKKLS